MNWFTQFAIESGCIKNDMNEREFKLLVREYFQADTVIEKSLLLDERLSAGHRKRDLRKKIDKELSRFTEQEQQELPFKD